MNEKLITNIYCIQILSQIMTKYDILSALSNYLLLFFLYYTTYLECEQKLYME